jgi:hypothetical protein
MLQHTRQANSGIKWTKEVSDEMFYAFSKKNKQTNKLLFFSI